MLKNLGLAVAAVLVALLLLAVAKCRSDLSCSNGMDTFIGK